MKISCLTALLFVWVVFLTAQPVKNPTRAALYSIMLPGGGQVYNHAYVKAGVVIGVQAYFVGSALYHDGKAKDFEKLSAGTSDAILQQEYQSRRKEYQELRTSDFWWIGITMALSALDAYVDAHLYDFEAQKDKLHLRFEGDAILLERGF